MATAAEEDARRDEFVVLSRAIDGSPKSVKSARSLIEREMDGADRPHTLLGFATAGDAELAALANTSATTRSPAGDGFPTSIWVGPLASVGAIAPLMRNRLS